MDPTLATILAAAIGGIATVVAAWLARRQNAATKQQDSVPTSRPTGTGVQTTGPGASPAGLPPTAESVPHPSIESRVSLAVPDSTSEALLPSGGTPSTTSFQASDRPQQSPRSEKPDKSKITRFTAAITLVTGEVLSPCEVSDYDPGPIGSGFEAKRVSLCRSIEEVAKFRLANDGATLQYTSIAKIDIIALSAEERGRLKEMANPYYREKVLKCNLTMFDGIVKTLCSSCRTTFAILSSTK